MSKLIRFDAGELTAGFTADEYRRRRCALARRLPVNSVAIIAAALPAHLPNTIIPYPGYRQDADFAYLTGMLQPGVVMMLQPQSGEDHRYTLFVPPRSKRDEVWNGAKVGTEAALRFFEADETHELLSMPGVIARAVRNATAVYADDDGHAAVALSAAGQMHSCGPLQALRPLVHALRWTKSPAEMQALRECAAADIEGFHSAIRASVPGALEYQVCHQHEHTVKMLGACRLAYPSVVGSGPGALIVHYAAMDRAMQSGDVLLMDAGCERRGYVSDITRTWPVGEGGFTNAQADVYEAVLEAHTTCLKAARPGVSLQDLHRLSVDVLSECLVNLGVGGGMSKTEMMRGGYQRYYPHSVGHWLGMDTHDTPTITTGAQMQPGCVFTIEPGLYFPADDLSVPKSLRGIGVRIEDDIAMTLDTAEVEVLSGGLPVGRREVEALVCGLRAR
mmetsp:Transcript_9838/g.15794  ORF Transcript_9838/g.15794 Transcript_9838/m.15794 type:complete len:447 (-) Transcript_9838:59-1399(-)